MPIVIKDSQGRILRTVGADSLDRADLSGANLCRARLAGLSLRGANLTGADCEEADLRRADLSWATFAGARLLGTRFEGADLAGVDFTGATDADLVLARTSIVPETGAFLAWKSCRGSARASDLAPEMLARSSGVILWERALVLLEIPADARRSSAYRLCRADHVKVLSVEGADVACSWFDPSVVYRAGETVRAHHWSDGRFEQSSSSGGIHFYLTRIEAMNH
jgi:hypothetical protein